MKLRGYTRYILAGLSGILMVLVFPGFNMSYLAWVALVPLLVSIYDANWKQSLKLGFLSGIIYLVGTLNWFLILYPFSSWFWVTLGFVALMLYLSTYIFIFTVSVNFITRCWILDAGYWRRLAYSFLVAVVWTAMEILKGHVVTGLPWVDLAHSQWNKPPIIQISSITGMYGVTFLIALINGAIANFLVDIRRWRESLKAAIVPIALLIISVVYGLAALSGTYQGEKIKIALIPGNIDQMQKLKSWKDPDWIFEKYKDISERAAAEKPDLMVWPETSVPEYIFRWGETPAMLMFLMKKWDTHLLMGIPHLEVYPDVMKTYNSAFLLSPNGEEVDRYYKIHLVPVSEYFPMKRYLPEAWQEKVKGVSDWDRGSRYTIFNTPKAKFGCVICFESIFPEISRKFVNMGADLMGIITNDSWFKGTYAPEQHYSIAPFRAIENRVPVFRCANGGISCIIDPWGRIISKIKPDSDESYLLGELNLRSGGSFYTRFGDYLPWACLAITVLLIFYTWWYQRFKGGQFL